MAPDDEFSEVNDVLMKQKGQFRRENMNYSTGRVQRVLVLWKALIKPKVPLDLDSGFYQSCLGPRSANSCSRYHLSHALT